eukprot:scaffold116689_cov20-Tisochrysis_lutea.AAC.5
MSMHFVSIERAALHRDPECACTQNAHARTQSTHALTDVCRSVPYGKAALQRLSHFRKRLAVQHCQHYLI